MDRERPEGDHEEGGAAGGEDPPEVAAEISRLQGRILATLRNGLVNGKRELFLLAEPYCKGQMRNCPKL